MVVHALSVSTREAEAEAVDLCKFKVHLVHSEFQARQD